MKGRAVGGIVLIVLGFFLVALDLLLRIWVVIGWGFLLLVIGLIIVLNRNEDQIEERKDIKTRSERK